LVAVEEAGHLGTVREGEATTSGRYTVADAVTDWLKYGLNGRDEDTLEKLRILAETHVIPGLGARELRNPARPSNVLSAEDIDKWLAQKATRLSTRTLRELLSILRRSIRRAQAREKARALRSGRALAIARRCIPQSV
jgi:hypothetical protein